MGAPSANDITHGLDLDPLEDISPDQRALIAVLMARAAERSYRRGVQQGASLHARRPEALPGDLHDWRYGTGTDASPWADSHRVEPAFSRLLTENPTLSRFLPKKLDPVGTLPDIDDLIKRTISLTARYSATFAGGEHEYAAATSALRALAFEVRTLGGDGLLQEIYDEIVERHGARAAHGLIACWLSGGILE